jgi:predicted nucleic acid-binding protein
VSPAKFLIDTGVLARLLLADGEHYGWDQAADAGLIALCTPVELEILRTSKSIDHSRQIEDILCNLFGWVLTDDRTFKRAREVQKELIRRGQHRSAGPIDLLVAATAELNDLTLLHFDNDFDCVAAVTGQPLERFIPR